MRDYIASNPTAGEWFEQLTKRAGISGLDKSLLAGVVWQAWEEGKDAYQSYSDDYEDWYATRGHDCTPPDLPENPYKEMPFA